MCKKENMEIVLQIINKHRETVKLLGFSHHQFIYRMGVMNGVFDILLAVNDEDSYCG